MKYNGFNKKFRQVLIASLAGLSTVGGSANAEMQYVPIQSGQSVMVPQPVVQPVMVPQTAAQPVMVPQTVVQPVMVPQTAAQQESVGDYLMKKQVAKGLKKINNAKVWDTKDTFVQVASLGVAGGSLAYNAHTGALKNYYDAVFGSDGLAVKYGKNPFDYDDRDKSTMKTVEEWGITAVDLALLPEKCAQLDASVVCDRKDLQEGQEDEKEPDDSRIYADNKKDPDTGKIMRRSDPVVRSRYRFDRIKNKQISELQKKVIKGEPLEENVDIVWDGIKIGAPVVLGIIASILHLTFKTLQKAASSVGNVIDKQQTISAIRATRS